MTCQMSDSNATLSIHQGPQLDQALKNTVIRQNPNIEDLNSKAKDAIRIGNFSGAVESYTEAIRCGGSSKIGLCQLHSNRSAALLMAGKASAALEDAVMACELDPNMPKSWGRCGVAAFYCGKFALSCLSFRRQYLLQPDPQSRKNLISALCRATATSIPGGASLPGISLESSSKISKLSTGPLDQVIYCFDVADRAVWLASALQVAVFAKDAAYKDKVFTLLMEYLIKFVDMKQEDLRESFPRGVLSSDCVADASLMYRKSVGTEYDNSHELAIVALILANLSTNFDSQQTVSAGSCHTPFVVKILESKAAMEQLFRLAGSTSHCFHTQHHVSVVYRNIVDHVCKRGTPEMMKQVLEGSTLEALEILKRNSADCKWEKEEGALTDLWRRLKKHPMNPENIIVTPA